MRPQLFDYPVAVSIPYYLGDGQEDMVDTVDTVQDLVLALEERGHMVRTEEVTKNNWRKAAKMPGEVFFNLVEDETYELYLKVGESVEKSGKAQVGHDLQGFKYAARKSVLKRRMQKLGISTPEFRVFNRRSKIRGIRGLEYPLIVKPSGQHAGIGISQDSVVIDEVELEQRVEYLFKTLPGEVVAEEYIDGREIHVTVVGNGSNLMVMPYAEVDFKGEFENNWEVYTYDAKWKKDSWEYWNCPVATGVKVSKVLDGRIKRLSKRAYKGLNCRDIVRFDLRVDKYEKPFIIDVNTNPSLKKDKEDATWRSAQVWGWDYSDLIETIVGVSYKRVYGSMPGQVKNRQFII